MKNYILSKSASAKLKIVVEAFEAQGATVTGGPDNFYTRCPGHDDSKASLSLADGDHGVMVKCHASCEQQELFQAVLAYTGLENSDFFYGAKNSAAQAGPVVTVAELAGAKKLPVELLYWAGIRDSERGILIPYWDESTVHRVRVRRGLKGSSSYWLPPPHEGHSITAYGAWLVPHYRPGRALYLVEGETDTLTGIYARLPVIGIPGKSMARSVIAGNRLIVAGFDCIFVIEEPDDYAERSFLEGVRRGLSDVHSIAQVFPMRLPEKDLSDLYVKRGPVDFWPAFQAAWAAAVDAPNWPAPQAVPPEAAEVCATVLSAKFGDVFTFRDLRRRHRQLDASKVRHAMEVMEQAYIVRRLAAARVVGRPVERYRRNPKLALTY